MREYRLKFLQAGSEGHYIFGMVLPVTLAVYDVNAASQLSGERYELVEVIGADHDHLGVALVRQRL
ncbi:hypothetical protein SDC9_204205 [bioreactor metagenome]|uniref:Uncharacterized protein n=1 Tax=bioreactor metagenome TaxID=1076179 RepID=A0A645IYJ3_9ZZZZ